MSVVPAEAIGSSRLRHVRVAVALVAAALLAALVVGPRSGPSEKVAGASPARGSASPISALRARGPVPTKAAVRRARGAYAKRSVSFVPNAGQVDRRVRYYAEGPSYSVYLTRSEAMLSLVKGRRGFALGLRFLGSNRLPQIAAEQRRRGRVNYLVGDDPSRWRTNLHTYGRVVYHDLWPGVDVAFRGDAGRLEYDVVLQPGADARQIRLAYRGAKNLALDQPGNLSVHTSLGVLTDARPRSYQVIGGRQVPVESAFTLERRAGRAPVIGFAIGRHAANHPVTIDPGLVYSTYVGGAGTDRGFGIAVDAGDNAYVTGLTNSTSFPTTVGAFSRTNNAGDAFVTKLDPSGFLVYSTFLGGSGSGDIATAIALDSAGSAYVTGLTNSTNFPTTTGAPRTSYGGGFDDAF